MQDYRRLGMQKYEVGPRITLAVKPTDNLVLRGAWGVYHQPIDLMTIPVEDQIDDIGRTERATHYVSCGWKLPHPCRRVLQKLENLTEQIRDQGRNAQILAPADSGNVRGL